MWRKVANFFLGMVGLELPPENIWLRIEEEVLLQRKLGKNPTVCYLGKKEMKRLGPPPAWNHQRGMLSDSVDAFSSGEWVDIGASLYYGMVNAPRNITVEPTGKRSEFRVE